MKVLLGGERMFTTSPPPVVFMEYAPWNLEFAGKLKRPADVLFKLATYGYQLTHAGVNGINRQTVLSSEEIQAIVDYPSEPGKYFDLVFVHSKSMQS